MITTLVQYKERWSKTQKWVMIEAICEGGVNPGQPAKEDGGWWCEEEGKGGCGHQHQCRWDGQAASDMCLTQTQHFGPTTLPHPNRVGATNTYFSPPPFCSFPLSLPLSFPSSFRLLSCPPFPPPFSFWVYYYPCFSNLGQTKSIC